MDADQAQLARLRDRLGESKAHFEAWAADMDESMATAKSQHRHQIQTDKGACTPCPPPRQH